MQLPLQIHCHRMERSDAVPAAARQRRCDEKQHPAELHGEVAARGLQARRVSVGRHHAA